ncbi:MAG: helix-turn-helix domain-containing protein [Synergistaceae bacterium]|nr:helix-turn-helix domain-containing protein [Synergistaceae bacterium]
MDENTFAARLRTLRKENGLSQADFATRIDLSRFTVMDWEKGQKFPDLKILALMAKILNTSVAYLIGETDDPARPVVGATTPKVPDGVRVDLLKSSGRIIQVPVYGKELSACCGGGFPDSDQIYSDAEEFIAIPSGFLGPVSSDPNYQPFIIYAEGDSMVNAGIHDGAQVIINPYDDVLDGDAALVEFATNPVTKNIAIKRVYWLDRCAVELRSACGDGWKRTFTADDFEEKSVRIIGKVEWVGNKPKRG